MCGITGLFAFDGDAARYATSLRESCTTMTHRGPDSGGDYHRGSVALGHRRLSILDTSEAGKQPMQTTDGRFVISFNGEIYNFPALRKELVARGVSFRSETDTEVLLHLYRQYGRDFLQHLNGFFALAIHDAEEDTLLVARDRIGIKPLLYHQNSERLAFASEMKALMAYDVPREIDRVSLQHYLHLNYIPAPHSIFDSVQKLLPGQYIWIDGKQVEVKTYYEIPGLEYRYQDTPKDYLAAQKELVSLLTSAVHYRMISDVPLGTFLSGGIDSSIITALASQKTKQLRTFSIGFRDQPRFDETRYAEAVAERYQTDHTTFSLTEDDLYGELEHVLDAIDEPFADSSALPVHILSRLTRQHVTVALSGDGADELFAGYHKYFGEWRLRQGGAAVTGVKMLRPLWRMLPKSRHTRIGNRVRQLDRFARGASVSAEERYWLWCGFADDETARQAVSPAYRALATEALARRRVATGEIQPGRDFNAVLRNDIRLILPNDMLAKVDLMSMANSLEVRVPFLDHRVVAFAQSLPVSFKIDGSMKKRIVQDAFRPLLPEMLYNRPKQGFEVPLLPWMRGSLRRRIEDDWLNDDFIRAQGIFAPEKIRQLREQIFSNDPGDVHARVWALIVFQNWWQRYMT